MLFGGPSSRRVYMRCLLIALIGIVSCLIAAFVILTLQSPRFDMDQPWFDKALSILKACLLGFSMFGLVLKFLVQNSDGPGDSAE